MPVNRPWRIDEDNEQRIVVKDDSGWTVHHVEYEQILGIFRTMREPEEVVACVDKAIAQERENCREMVGAVNATTECSKCGEWVDGMPCDANCPYNGKAQAA